MNRRDFIKKLGALAAAGALAPAVVDALALPVDTFDRRFDVIEYSVPIPIDDMNALIAQVKRSGSQPNTIIMPEAHWDALVEMLSEHHPELAAEAKAAA